MFTTNKTNTESEIQVKSKVLQKVRREKAKIHRRLAKLEGGCRPRGPNPEFSHRKVTYEMAERTRAISAGGIGAIHNLVRDLGVAEALDAGVSVLKQHRPYFESDHILNIAYNVLCGGQTLDDIELRRNDLGYLELLGARAIPDPTTSGDFCRRFEESDCWDLMDAINRVRLKAWQARGPGLTEQVACIDADGTYVGTGGKCKEGMDLSYKGGWGYHPLLVSLANTAEPLYIVNRSGNRPSHDRAAEVFDRAIELCREGGFTQIRLRGDTDFSLTRNFDRWHEGGVKFVFGYDSSKAMKDKAELVDEEEYTELLRKSEEAFSKDTRAKQPRIKENIIRERGYLNRELIAEDLAEFEHRPVRAKWNYRIIVLRKQLREERGQTCLGVHFRYFFYVTNDWTMSCEDVVKESNQRCDQENLIAQLGNGSRALHAPVNTLNANWAYMLMASLAWSLKSWFALTLRSSPRWRERHDKERESVLRMEFRTFLNQFMLIPAQILQSGRRLILRILSYRPQLFVLLRALEGH